MNDETLSFLLPFVQAKVKRVTAHMLEERDGEAVLCAYHEVAGTLDHFRWDQDIQKWIHCWTGGSNECCHWIDIAGAACWTRAQ